MKKLVIKLALSLVFLLGVYPIIIGAETQMTEGENSPIMKVNFVPFVIETFAPITMNDIEAKTSHTV